MAREIGFKIRILTKGPRHTPQAWAEKLLWCQKNIGIMPSTEYNQHFTHRNLVKYPQGPTQYDAPYWLAVQKRLQAAYDRE